MSKTTSTPVKIGSKNIGADNHADVRGRSQKDLKHDVGNELKGCTWKFTAKELARALAKKTRKTPYVLGTIDTIDEYDLTEHTELIRDKLKPALSKFEEGKPDEILKKLQGKGERDQYDGLRDLTDFAIRVCHGALGDKAGAYYATLKVVVHDTPMQDTIGGADALKPDLAGVNGFPRQDDTNCAKQSSDTNSSDPGPTLSKSRKESLGENVSSANAPEGRGTKRKAEDDIECTLDQLIDSIKLELFWRPPNGRERHALLVPFEVKSDSWPELIRQAGTYARCMFAAHPYRQYALVIGYKYDTQELSFLVFHRGGLTACTPLKLTDKKGRSEMLRLFLTILTWDSPADAGIPEWTDGSMMILPSGPEGKSSRSFQVEELLHCSNCIVGHASWVARFIAWGLTPPNVSQDSFVVGQTTPVSSASIRPQVRPTAESSVPPSSKRLRKAAVESQAQKQRKRSGKPLAIPRSHGDQHLRFVPHVIITPGKQSIDYPDRDLVLKMAWHSKDRYDIEARVLDDCSGDFGVPKHYCSCHVYLKDGIPLTNHLFLPKPTRRSRAKNIDDMKTLNKYYWKVTDQKEPQKPDRRSAIATVMEYRGHSLIQASTPWELIESLLHGALGWYNLLQKGYLHRDISIHNVLMSSTGYQAQPMELIPDGSPANDILRDRLKRALENLNVHDQCKGDTIDAGEAIDCNIYFDYPHVGMRSGTMQFMSDKLLYSWEYKEPHLHSPIDDLFSFYHVAQWAAVFNNSRFSEKSPPPYKLLDLRQKISGNLKERQNGRELIVNEDSDVFRALDYGSFLQDCHPFLFSWYGCLRNLELSWRPTLQKATLAMTANEDPHNVYMPLFQRYALDGITQLAECVVACQDELGGSS